MGDAGSHRGRGGGSALWGRGWLPRPGFQPPPPPHRGGSSDGSAKRARRGFGCVGGWGSGAHQHIQPQRSPRQTSHLRCISWAQSFGTLFRLGRFVAQFCQAGLAKDVLERGGGGLKGGTGGGGGLGPAPHLPGSPYGPHRRRAKF